MDPLTLLAAAQAAFGGIQAAIAAGKEIQAVAADLSDLWGSLAKLTQVASSPHKPTIFSSKSAEQVAIERYTARAEAEELAAKAKGLFISHYGISAWDQVQREVINIRKEIERQRWEEERESAKRMEEIRDATAVTLIVMFGVSIILCVGIILLGVK